jgi:apolipoprotein N-acyltransferase
MLAPTTVCFLIKKNKAARCVLFCLTWLFVEYIMCHWSLGLPFYLVGYLLRFNIEFIQWYEYTGVLGGSLLILAASLVIYTVFSAKRKLLLTVLPILALPLIFSYLRFDKMPDTTNPDKSVRIGVAQTAFDNDLLMNSTEICNQIKSTLISEYDAGYLFYLFPEAILKGVYHLKYLDMSKDFLTLKRLNCSSLKSNLIIGAILHDTDVENGMSKRKYNSAVKINCDGYGVISKNKFIPVEERIPNFLGFLKGHVYSDDFHRNPNVNQVFQIEDKKTGFLICYEALLGEYAAQTGKEADFLAMMANEVAFSNTVAVEQYLQVAQIRCIEQRKWMVKSSNMGYSAVIDDKGVIRKKIMNSDAINIFSANIKCSDRKTFYAIHGDYIGRLSGVLILLFTGCLLFNKILINV